MGKYLLTDLDHTLTDAKWRDHLKPLTPKELNEWDAYHEPSILDKPILDIVDLIRALYAENWNIIGLTARPSRYRFVTERWLLRHCIPCSEVLMRTDENAYVPSEQVKLSLFYERFPSWATSSHRFIILDDHPLVASAFSKLNLTVLQIHGRTSHVD